MGMSFRTFHFDGAIRVRGYVQWLEGYEKRETYALHPGVLTFVEIYPNAKFLWSHRNPVKVLGAVCSLIDAEQLTWRTEVHRTGDGLPAKVRWRQLRRRLVR
jgi:Sulfotransferase family